MDPSDVMEQLSSLLYSYSHSPFATALLSAYEKHHLKNSLKSAKSKDQIIELTSKLNAIDLLYLGCDQSNARKERLKNVENSVQARLEKKQNKVDNLKDFQKSSLTMDKILKMKVATINPVHRISSLSELTQIHAKKRPSGTVGFSQPPIQQKPAKCVSAEVVTIDDNSDDDVVMTDRTTASSKNNPPRRGFSNFTQTAKASSKAQSNSMSAVSKPNDEYQGLFNSKFKGLSKGNGNDRSSGHGHGYNNGNGRGNKVSKYDEYEEYQFNSTFGRPNQNEYTSIPGGFSKRKHSPQESESDEDSPEEKKSSFLTAREKLKFDNAKKGKLNGPETKKPKTLGTSGHRKFVPPFKRDKENDTESKRKKSIEPETEVDERLKHLDPKMIQQIESEIIDNGRRITWDDIAGLEHAKKIIKEIVVYPLLRPDLFCGLRKPSKGVLLFGPPGTGKTLFAKCIASQSNATFFSISSSSLTSKWVGDGEKLVRALFAVARIRQPAVIFIDEIDSLLTQRSDGEQEASRRIKTEFLIQFDGCGVENDEQLLVIGATNRPQELDEAARRRFRKRLYIPLPDPVGRKQIIKNLMGSQKCELNEQEIDEIVELTDGYSGSDMDGLCREAALGPIRDISFEDMGNIAADAVRPIMVNDFKTALKQIRASVSTADLKGHEDWNELFGSLG